MSPTKNSLLKYWLRKIYNFYFFLNLPFQTTTVKITIILFFLDNHREYIENAIKPITKAKYRDLTKKKKKKVQA